MKKYWLTVEQRTTLVNLLHDANRRLRNEMDESKAGPKTKELCEQALQEQDMLISLFNVHESERL